MDTDTALRLATALARSGLLPARTLAVANGLLAAPADDAALADALLAAGALTPYQHRKVRIGRCAEIHFGPYLILDKIGEGGMGKVYRAVHTPDGRLVALKIIRHHLMANKTVLKRYEREAAAAAALDHPNIVKLYDSKDNGGRYYIAMEYVDGIDLSRLVKGFGTPPAMGLRHYQEACEYVRQAALGLQHAHEKGLIHRDIKPANLLVYGERALPGTRGKAVVKILDMGLVRSTLEAEDDAEPDLTRHGTVVGTPDYMAPEQAKNSSTVDARADLYSLGCALYFLLKGQPLFPDGNSIDKLIRHQLDPPPELKYARPDVPGGVGEVLAKLLKKKPSERFQTAGEVARALAPFVEGGSGVSTRLASPAAPAYEPFSFTDDPDAVVSTLAAPTETTALPTPPASAVAPAVRLRVVTPKSGTAPATTAIPKPNPVQNSEVLPARRPPRTPAKARPGSGTSARHTPLARREARRPVKRETGPAIPAAAWVVIGVGVLLALLIVIVALTMRAGGARADARPRLDPAPPATMGVPITDPNRG